MIRMCMVAFLSISTTSFAYSEQEAEIKKIVIEQAKIIGVEPALALGIARVESNFNPLALSSAGAKGVMQIMPQTAKLEFGVPSYKLYNPTTNIKIGIEFIKHLIEVYDGRVDIALSHYNGGSRVRSATGELGVIPATKQYVRSVLQYAHQYKLAGYNQEFTPQFQPSFVDKTKHQALLSNLDDFTGKNRIKPASSLSNQHQSINHESIVYSAHQSKIEILDRLQIHNLTRQISQLSPVVKSHANARQVSRNIEKRGKQALVDSWESAFN
ncbi:lytic transglycosylase domain-containing protein [uncultured Paraglaciecola sp.]|uniref:lytic transglycosylase domain-containing protein n=1 Tax=uncultured Paraglaciecola sp. TaxID=1765024 RepID=UPI00261980FB|nr:lytic transglycosylase domain-containing protein [uncultured Paraglaciecola sp.]